MLSTTEEHPPKIPLIRGRAELDVVVGIPGEYLQMNGTDTATAEQRAESEAEIRSLYYNGMVRIVVTPAWANQFLDRARWSSTARATQTRLPCARQGRAVCADDRTDENLA